MTILSASVRIVACPAGSVHNGNVKVMVKKAFISKNALSPVTGVTKLILIRAFRPL
jgi:hypothetical protein